MDKLINETTDRLKKYLKDENDEDVLEVVRETLGMIYLKGKKESVDFLKENVRQMDNQSEKLEHELMIHRTVSNETKRMVDFLNDTCGAQDEAEMIIPAHQEAGRIVDEQPIKVKITKEPFDEQGDPDR